VRRQPRRPSAEHRVAQGRRARAVAGRRRGPAAVVRRHRRRGSRRHHARPVFQFAQHSQAHATPHRPVYLPGPKPRGPGQVHGRAASQR